MNEQLQVPTKQIIYNGTVIDVIPQPGGVILHIAVPGCGELLAFPMSSEVAQEIGRKLTAPRLVAVPAAEHVNGNGKAL